MTIHIINNNIIFKDDDQQVSSHLKPEIKIKLSVSSSRLLCILIEHCNKTVKKEMLMEEIWGKQGFVVTDNSLYQAILNLRKNLIDLGEDREIIRNIPKQGYILGGKVTTVDTNAVEDAMPDSNAYLDHPRAAINIQSRRVLKGKKKSIGIWMLLTIISMLILTSINTLGDMTIPGVSYFLAEQPDANTTIYLNNKTRAGSELFAEMKNTVLRNSIIQKIYNEGHYDAIYINNTLSSEIKSYFFCKGALEKIESKCISVLLLEEL